MTLIQPETHTEASQGVMSHLGGFLGEARPSQATQQWSCHLLKGGLQLLRTNRFNNQSKILPLCRKQKLKSCDEMLKETLTQAMVFLRRAGQLYTRPYLQA
jgi:hypothetical protein